MKRTFWASNFVLKPKFFFRCPGIIITASQSVVVVLFCKIPCAKPEKRDFCMYIDGKDIKVSIWVPVDKYRSQWYRQYRYAALPVMTRNFDENTDLCICPCACWWTSTLRTNTYTGTMMTNFRSHYSDVIMGAMTSQITSLTIVYSSVFSGTDQREHVICLCVGNSPVTGEFPGTNGQLHGKCFHLMTSSCNICMALSFEVSIHCWIRCFNIENHSEIIL